MTIDPYAVEDFLDRELLDMSCVKKWPLKKMQRAVTRYERVKPILSHRTYQLPGLYLGLRYGSIFLSYDMGLGKSKIIIDLLRNRMKTKEVQRMLVLVPGSGNISQWVDELALHAPELRALGLAEGLDRKKRASVLWDIECDVVISTYAGLQSLVCGVERNSDGEVRRTRGGASRRPVAKLVRALAKRFQMVVADESSAMKNPQSVNFAIARALAPLVKFRHCLSGTPFSSDPMGVWSQFYFVDLGATLGTTLGMFREAFFEKKYSADDPWGSWVLKDGMDYRLNQVLANASIRYEESECLDLPKRVGGYRAPMLRSAVLSPHQFREATRVFDEMKSGHMLDLSIAEMGQPEVKPLYYQLRTISSGYLKNDDGEIFFKKNPKLALLLELLDELEDEQIIIFIHYKTTRVILEEALKKKKITYACVVGGKAGKAKQIQNFKTKKARVLICSLAGAYGLNLQFCRNMAFFETPDSIAARKQAEGRIARQGQKRTCHFWDFISHNTYDTKIIRNLQKRGKVLSRVINGRDE